MIGMAKAPVFPEPVLPLATKSLPSRMRGIARSCFRIKCFVKFLQHLGSYGGDLGDDRVGSLIGGP